jgi:GMP synthase (glutamine-hydrolysing)
MDKITVIDFGGQYAHLITNRIRRLGCYSDIVHSDINIEELKSSKGIILSGGPQNISENDSLKIDPEILSLNIPILGICYGHQLITHLLGGTVSRGEVKEYGKAELKISKQNELFKDVSDNGIVWMSHGDYVSKLGNGFEIIGKTNDCNSAAVANFDKKIYGLQFHPEVTHSEDGMKMLENFAFDICGCEKNWDMKQFIINEISNIQKTIGDKKVFLLVSGGVDSNVCFALLNKALGSKNVYGLHIDNGFMRKDESMKVEKAFRAIGLDNFHAVDSSEEFLEAVKGVTSPEEKRKIIGTKFIEIQAKETEKSGLDTNHWILGQGTIYPDTIESGDTKNSQTIKTHHNRVEAVQKLIDAGKVIEPIKDLYKDEVREVGRFLGLPDTLIDRHPFPGPGLAVRCLCLDEMEECLDLDIADSKVLPIKSVGVQGDSRTYAHPLALLSEKSWDEFEKISTHITNNHKEINRVVWLLSDTSLDNINIVKGGITKERMDLLRIVDDIVTSYLKSNNLYHTIWQMPVVLIPLSFNGGESIVLRPINSNEAMTANFTHIPKEHVKTLTKKIMEIDGIDAVFYDVTNKPPGTIEWE